LPDVYPGNNFDIKYFMPGKNDRQQLMFIMIGSRRSRKTPIEVIDKDKKGETHWSNY